MVYTPNQATREFAKTPTWTGPPVRVGVIGGSGLYKLDGLEVVQELNPITPWGPPSSPITIAKTSSGVHVAFLARHGIGHFISPSQVPSLANISALKHIGVRAVIAFTAVGSLREEVAPRDFVVPSQIIDRTKGVRRASFFGEGDQSGIVAHATFGDPFDETLRPVVEDVVRKELSQLAPEVKTHGKKTLVAMEGPQFSTRAESLAYRQLGGDIINMSALPEAKLAREAELSYTIIATSTDYDAWRESEGAVDVAEVMKSLQENVKNSHAVLKALLEPVAKLVEDEGQAYKNAQNGMRFSIMTKPELVSKEAKESIQFVLPWYGQ
ncbi:Methylthioadenosine phosphorylase [Meira miltonrushii]|uniref:S-methyl-5'-thioadenosine phosphorylase n=1 Tax=Meira miltonrushii TaxID=1280837 RepID=A0A316V9M6_9BASI|nr:Methylthioadenosine phosphorylase [Meira miltonrushii]PWN33954.1 Methylthioadenosine phosphorylase [Meira miltonrushii]